MSNWTLLNKARITPEQDKTFGTTPADGFNGAFCIIINNLKVKIIASDGEGWRHVSVALHDQPKMCPSWQLMCKVKELFWDDEDWVVQYHPAKSQYIDNHPGCLHLWQPLNAELPKPNLSMVGFRNKEDLEKAFNPL